MAYSPVGLRALLVGLLAACAAGGGSDASAQSTKPGAPAASAARERYEETFDAAWRVVFERHFDTTFNGVSWAGVRAELLPRARSAANRDELRRVIREMLGRLGQSHFSLIADEESDALPSSDTSSADAAAPSGPRGSAPVRGAASRPATGGELRGTVGLELRSTGGRFVVTAVDSAGAAFAAGVRPGWELRQVDETSLATLHQSLPTSLGEAKARFHASLLAARTLDGEVGSSTRVRFVDGRGVTRQLTLRRRRPTGDPVKFGNLPLLYARIRHASLRAPGGRTVGVIAFNVWMPPILRRFDAAMDELRGTDGIVIDLRGNPGGVAAMVMGTSGHFLNDRVALGTMRTRGNELRFVSNPRRVDVSGGRVMPYTGPVAILIDGLTGSTSEMFAGGLQAIGRARVFGETSAGLVLPARTTRLPNGDVLYHAFADFLTPGGARLEGRGVIPDVEVRLSRADLLSGRDTALEEAMKWIAEQPKQPRPPR